MYIICQCEVPLSKDAFCQVLLILSQWFWRRFSYFVNVFPLFPYSFLFEKDVVLYLNENKLPLPRDASFHAWLQIGSVVLHGKNILNFVMYFRYLIIECAINQTISGKCSQTGTTQLELQCAFVGPM